MTTPGPTPAASAFYGAGGTALPTAPPTMQGTPSASATGQSVTSNVNGYIPQATGSPGTGNVYMGTAPGTTQNVGRFGYRSLGGPETGGPTETYLTTADAQNLYYTWSKDQQDAFRAKMAMVDSSYLTATDAQLAAAWGGTGGLVAQAAAYLAAGQKVTPWDILSKDISSNAGGKGKFGTTQTRNISTVQLTSAADANAIFMSAAQSLLGRAPTADELTAFRNNLHGLEQANPTQQTIEEQFNPQGFMIDKNVLKSSGGVNAGAQQNLALQQAKANPEYGAYQAATTYMGALQELLAGGKV